MAQKKKAKRASPKPNTGAKQKAELHDDPTLEESQAPASAGSESSAASAEAEAVQQAPFIVGIGASAGGLEALTDFLQAMPPDSGMAFVIVSHLDPEHASALSELLARANAMPVLEVKDATAIEPGHVYVMPPNRDMTVSNRSLRLARRAETRGQHMPIDTFLQSLAADCGSRSIGVILSGTGSDGTLGLKAIQEAAGLTFAQDDSARFTGMPHSAIAAGVVDAALPPAEIAAELLRIARLPPAVALHEPPPAAGARQEGAFERILQLLSDATGVDFIHYKQSTLQRRVRRRMVLRRMDRLEDYLECLEEDPTELRMLFEEVLIPVTSFFREPETFEVLKTTILPHLMANRPPKATFRVWAPGCASGEEVYSLAICLLEYMAEAQQPVPIKVFGTDISERSIEAARAGVFGEGIVSEVSPRRLQRYFLKTSRGYEVSQQVRDACIFARHDLTKDPPFSQLDLVSCRNLLIYLGPVLQDRALPVLHYALHPGGILILGGSETVGRHGDLFELIDKKHKIYQRSSIPSRLSFEYEPRTPAVARTIRDIGTDRGRGFVDAYREADRVVLARFAPSGVLVDENYHVIQYRGDVGPYLKPASGPPTTELLLMAREGLLADLRDTLARARQNDAPARAQGIRVKTNDHFAEIDLEAIPIFEPVSGLRYFIVLFAPRPAASEQPPRNRPGAEEESERDREIARLGRDLASTRSFLQSVIEQKESANEELRAANEEVVSANEELQSTNEELTTAKEELQATNEELTTVNDELQSRIRSTNQLADDLVNLIETTRIPIVVLGTDLCIRRFTPAAQDVMNLRPGDVGRPFTDLRSKIDVPRLEALAQEVIDTLEIKQLEVSDAAGAWYKLYIRPYKTLEHKVGGVVLMLIDIDALKRREQEIQESRDYAVNIVETVREPLLVLDGDLRVRTANRAFYESFGLSPADAQGRRIYELKNGVWNISALRTLLEEILPQNSHFEDFEVEHEFPGVGPRTMLLNAHRLMQGADKKAQLILLAIEDITVRKHAERLRHESEERLRTMVDTAVDAIITIDERGIISSINAATERMFGYLAGELIGQNVRLLMPPPYRDEHDAYLEHYRQTGEKHIIGVGREVQARRKDGSSFPVDLAVSEYEDDGQRRFTGLLRDLSARKALEREVLEVATLEQQRIGRELHDTTAQELTALGLLAESLAESARENAPVQAQLAGKLVEGLRRVLSQVRTVSRGLVRVEIDAEGLMAALEELAAQTAEMHHVTCRFDRRQPVHLADNNAATQLYSIAREAVANALKHSGAQNITITLDEDDESVRLRVQDDGVGFTAPPLDSKGMGLTIMRYRAGLINAHLSIGAASPAGSLVACTITKRHRHG
ncbi:MAG TPA: chemotaxis protein CheB [Pirellulales bacterium]|nr:chemotaxis protein CheB [Pirellulales bacterium]